MTYKYSKYSNRFCVNLPFESFGFNRVRCQKHVALTPAPEKDHIGNLI